MATLPQAKVTVIDPVIDVDYLTAESLPDVPGLEISQVALTYGTRSIESRLDDELAAPGVIAATIAAEKAGAAAVVINCMDDPGVMAARETVRIPVVGPAEASMHLALTLARSFGIITTSSEDIPVVWELVERLNLAHRCASIRALDIPVLQLEKDVDATVTAYRAAASAAVREDHAASLISGCTLLSPLTPQVQQLLRTDGVDVPIINPIHAALQHALTLIRLGLTHSPHAFPKLAPKALAWPDSTANFGPTIAAEVDQ